MEFLAALLPFQERVGLSVGLSRSESELVGLTNLCHQVRFFALNFELLSMLNPGDWILESRRIAVIRGQPRLIVAKTL
jgi:hypothetical protein